MNGSCKRFILVGGYDIRPHEISREINMKFWLLYFKLGICHSFSILVLAATYDRTDMDASRWHSWAVAVVQRSAVRALTEALLGNMLSCSTQSPARAIALIWTPLLVGVSVDDRVENIGATRLVEMILGDAYVNKNAVDLLRRPT